jgi:hypothetical protein
MGAAQQQQSAAAHGHGGQPGARAGTRGRGSLPPVAVRSRAAGGRSAGPIPWLGQGHHAPRPVAALTPGAG